MQKVKKELKEIIKSVKAYMEAQAVAGIEEFYLKPTLVHKGGVKPLPKRKSLEDFRREVIECRQCPTNVSRNEKLPAMPSL